MAKKKTIRKPQKRGPRRQEELTPVTVFVCAALLGMIAYLVGEVALDPFPHPIHWTALAAGILAGVVLGKWVVNRYGDIFGF